jgi:uncharacterized protein DUF4159
MKSRTRVWPIISAVVALGLLPMLASGQRRGRPNIDMSRDFGGEYYIPPAWRGNPAYDGRVTFVRIKYRGYERMTEEGPGWAHDYPTSETHFSKIMREITTERPFVEAPPVFGSTILTLDDPLLMKYPIAYLSEPGGWHMNATELAGFKKYIQRGGFLIFDDMGFRSTTDLQNLVYEWKRAFPNAQVMEIPQDHPVFDSFFKIDFTKIQPYYRQGTEAHIFGFYEDNDPKKRLLAVINDNNDLGEYIEFSEQGFNVTPTNEAYKLAVNYFVYALTH